MACCCCRGARTYFFEYSDLDVTRVEKGRGVNLYRRFVTCHEETFNIHSHFWPGVAILASMCVFPAWENHLIVWTVYWSGICVCFMTSAAYHLVCDHPNPTVREVSLTADLCGILCLMLTGAMTTISCMFPDYPEIRSLYLCSFIVMVAASLGYFVLVDRMRWRNQIFQLLGFVVFTMAVHDLLLRRSVEERWVVARAVLTTTPTYATGFAFYLSSFPESRWPDRFHFLGSSHNIWHIFVILGTIVHAFNLHSLLLLFYSI